MVDLFNEAPTLAPGLILIVDDDPITAGMLSISLAAAGHEIIEVNSGEDALARLRDSKQKSPDVVILDIEMGSGINGYETCLRMREMETLHYLPVIFLSGHDSLDDRLRAYDAGGSDFTAKPFNPDEMLRKVAVSIRHRQQENAKTADNKSSFNAAMTAMTSLGESGVTLNYSRNALGCRSLQALATLTLDSMATLGLNCHIQLRAPSSTLTLTPHGAASPLEVSVIEKMRSMDRIFSFGNRAIINYTNVSLLVQNMPTANADLCGRIRDHGAMIVEAAEQAVDNINLRVEAVIRAQELRDLAASARVAVEELRNNYRDLQVSTRLELDTMAHTIEGMYIHLGLSNKQEFTISDTVRDAVDRVLDLFEQSSELDQKFAGIAMSLTKAGEYSVSQEEEAAPTIDLW
ncbi:MAG: response regulator [Gallionellaceae bacterium]